ncbi:MAG: FAD-dependent monooxygenase [Pseudomonadota bacterium]
MPTAIVAGGGIGGLTAALCLQRIGWDVEVMEQAPEITEIGAGLQISPNGFKVLDLLDLAAQVRAVAYEPEILGLRIGNTGRTIFEVPMKDVMVANYGAPYLQVHRADLIGVLSEAVTARLSNPVRTGTRVTGYVRDGAKLTTMLSTGDGLDCDLLIGADGIHSAIREQMLGPDAPRFTGNVAWRAVVPRSELTDTEIPPGAVVWAGSRRHAVTYPLRGGELINFVGIVEQDGWQTESWVEKGAPEDLAKDFDGWAPLIQNLIQHAPETFKWALFDRAPLPRWSDGSVVLLGDACHPMLPSLAQGACQAIEDAWVLADHLSRGSDPAAALPLYFAARLDRTAKVQATAASNLQLFHASGIRRTAMFGVLGAMNRFTPSLLLKKFDWVYRHDVTTGQGAG